jgi:hypothetical protein
MSFMKLAATLAIAAAVGSPAFSKGTIILEGSDAIGFHAGFGEPAAQQYTDQTFSAIGGSSALTVAVVGSTSSGNPVVSGSHAITLMSDLSGAGALSNYAAIYFIGGGGCCSSSPAAIAGRTADLTSYYNGGGTIEIGNYDGNSGWDFLTGGSNNWLNVAGVSGALGGPSCTDEETVTAVGTANGFTQPAPVGCWTHQAYAETYFAGLGFTKSYFAADPAFAVANPGYGTFSSLLSNGNTITGGGNVPEPASWVMMIAGFGIVGAAMRRKALAAA